MKKKFSSSYTDLNDGTEVTTKTVVRTVDLRKDLGEQFVFIETTYSEPDRQDIYEEVSFPKKDVKKLIKALKKILEKR